MNYRLNLTKLTQLLFALTLLALLLGQLSSVAKNSGSNVYLFDPVILLANIGFAVILLKMRYSPVYTFSQVSFVGFLLAGLLGYFGAADFLSSRDVLVSLSYWLRVVNYLVFWVLLQSSVFWGLLTREYVVRVVLVLGAIFCAFGFVQLLVLPDFTVLDANLGWDPHKNRLTSTLLDPNYAGALICILVALLPSSSYSPKIKSILLLTFILALLLTFSRSAWGLFAIMTLVYGILKSPKVLIVAVLLMILAYAGIPRIQTRLSGITDPSDSAHFRLISWRESVSLFNESPIVGQGFNTLRYAKKHHGFLSYDNLLVHSGSGSDSSLLYVAVTTGIVGLAFYLLFLCCTTLDFFKRRDVVGIGLLTGLLLESQFINSLFYPQIIILLFIYISTSEK